MSENKLWGDFDSDDDREYLEQGLPVEAKTSQADQCDSAVNLHVKSQNHSAAATKEENSWYRSGTKTDTRSVLKEEPQSWRASPSNSPNTLRSQRIDTTKISTKDSGWRPNHSSASRNGPNHSCSPSPSQQPHDGHNLITNLNGLGIQQKPIIPNLSVNGQIHQSRAPVANIFIQPPSDTPISSPRVSPQGLSNSQASPLLPGPWIPPYSQPQPNQGVWVNFNNPYHPSLANSPNSRGRSVTNGSPRTHTSHLSSPRQLAPLLVPSNTSPVNDSAPGSPSPRVLIMNHGGASPRTLNINYELEALYDMVPRSLALILRQQTPSLLRNVVTLLLAQPYGLTWQQLCLNYSARYKEILICPLTASGATMSPNSILSECCHRHEGLLAQDTPGKFRVKPDLLKLDTRPAVKKALLRLQEESMRRICIRCRSLMDDPNREELLCPTCAATDAKISVSPVSTSPQQIFSRACLQAQSSLSPPSQAPPKPAAVQLMPSDFRDLTVGGDLPNQILAVLPPMGLPFVQISKAFQNKHGVSIKVQLKGKLAEFLETMSSYDLIAIDNKQGPVEGWRVRSLRSGDSDHVLKNSRPKKINPKITEEVHI